MGTCDWVSEALNTILHTSQEAKEQQILKEEESDQDEWIWDDEMDVAIISSYMMLLTTRKCAWHLPVQSLLNQIKETFSNIFVTQAQDLEALLLQIVLIENLEIPAATPYRSSIADDEFIETAPGKYRERDWLTFLNFLLRLQWSLPDILDECRDSASTTGRWTRLLKLIATVKRLEQLRVRLRIHRHVS